MLERVSTIHCKVSFCLRFLHWLRATKDSTIQIKVETEIQRNESKTATKQGAVFWVSFDLDTENIIDWTIIKESRPGISLLTSKGSALLSTSQRLSNFILILFAAKHVDVVIFLDILQHIANTCIKVCCSKIRNVIKCDGELHYGPVTLCKIIYLIIAMMTWCWCCNITDWCEVSSARLTARYYLLAMGQPVSALASHTVTGVKPAAAMPW